MIETKREKEKKDIICMCVINLFEINHTSKHFSSQQLTNNYFQQKNVLWLMYISLQIIMCV